MIPWYIHVPSITSIYIPILPWYLFTSLFISARSIHFGVPPWNIMEPPAAPQRDWRRRTQTLVVVISMGEIHGNHGTISDFTRKCHRKNHEILDGILMDHWLFPIKNGYHGMIDVMIPHDLTINTWKKSMAEFNWIHHQQSGLKYFEWIHSTWSQGKFYGLGYSLSWFWNPVPIPDTCNRINHCGDGSRLPMNWPLARSPSGYESTHFSHGTGVLTLFAI